MCVFCKIISGEIPSFKVYENEQVLAFLDIKPVHPGHTLVIPKKHAANLEEINELDLKEVILAVKKIGQMLKDRLAIPGYNVSLNNDPVAGQEISHLHFHVIPRHPNDGLKLFPQRTYTPGEAEEVLQKLLT